MESHSGVAVRAIFERDSAARSLGIRLRSVSSGYIELTWEAADFAINSLGLIHGGYLYLLADTAFAYCCVSLNRMSATRTAEIAYLAASSSRELVATAAFKQQSGRTTICDVTITDGEGMPLAEFRGHGALAAANSHTK